MLTRIVKVEAEGEITSATMSDVTKASGLEEPRTAHAMQHDLQDRCSDEEKQHGEPGVITIWHGYRQCWESSTRHETSHSLATSLSVYPLAHDAGAPAGAAGAGEPGATGLSTRSAFCLSRRSLSALSAFSLSTAALLTATFLSLVTMALVVYGIVSFSLTGANQN